MKKTKIICTIGPNADNRTQMRSLVENGMDIARFNFSHGDHAEQKARMDMLKEIRAELGKPIAILLDTKGPEIRTGRLKEGKKVRLEEGQLFALTTEQIEGDYTRVSITYEGLKEDISVGQKILIDDGLIELEVRELVASDIQCVVINGGELGERKGVNVPNVQVKLSALTNKDKEDIAFGVEQGVDFIAASFVRSAEAILEIRTLLKECNAPYIPIIAKIENAEGLKNIDEILEVADGVMIARGDLGIEVPQEKIPGIQRMLIKKCTLAKKPVIVATQMLHTMINNPRPTRAEVTDIANAIYYRTDALMLSGETAYGKYPVEAVRTMTKIAAQAEKDKSQENNIKIPLIPGSNDVTAFLAKQAVMATDMLNIKAIITDSFSGRTARNLAAFRGKNPVLAICYKEKTMRHLALSYGVEAIYMPEKANGQAYYFAALRKLMDDGVLSENDMVAYLSSGKQGSRTSFLEINVVGDVLGYGLDYVLPNRNRYL